MAELKNHHRSTHLQIIRQVSQPGEPSQFLSKSGCKLGENPLSTWELRVGKHRVFYDVIPEGEFGIVKIKAVGHKVHNKLYIGGKEFEL